MAEFYGSKIWNISDISLPRLWCQVKVSARPNCQRRGTFYISLSVHMCCQEAICKPDSVLCDKKCNFSLPEKENTWRNSNQRVSLTCHLQRVRAVYPCQRGAGGITSSLPSLSLFLTRCDAGNLFLLACLTCPGGFAASQTPASPVTMTGNKRGSARKLMDG